MASGSVRRYDGARGVVWFIQYRDATGRQIKERVGREDDGSTRRSAERALRHRLTRVEQDGWRRPERLTFAEFARRFMDDYIPARNLKTTTVDSYRHTIDSHLLPVFGDVPLEDVDPEAVDTYVAHKTTAGLGPKTITNHLLLLNTMFKRAQRWRLIAANPIDSIDRPRQRKPDMTILAPAEIARYWTAYCKLIDVSGEADRPWWQLGRTVTFVALGTALRRGELLGLRWSDVALLESRLSVRQAFVRGEITTPKSDASIRTIDLGPRTCELLQEHWTRSAYRGDDDIVFCHPSKGTPADPSKLSGFMRDARDRAKISGGFRVFHDLRHTALTLDAASGNPAIYVQHRAGHSQASITERYLHASQTAFPDAARRAEESIFSGLE